MQDRSQKAVAPGKEGRLGRFFALASAYLLAGGFTATLAFVLLMLMSTPAVRCDGPISAMLWPIAWVGAVAPVIAGVCAVFALVERTVRLRMAVWCLCLAPVAFFGQQFLMLASEVPCY